jgi:hypothetical protein
MKKSISFIVVLFLIIEVHSQVVEGTVFDQTTKETIYSASIYFDGTSNGTLSDQNGRFKINTSKFKSIPLTVSAIGYFSATITDFSIDKPLVVFLNRKLFELDEVVVNARSQTRERKINMTIFKKEFLGTTANAMACQISNEKEIRFKYSNDGDTLKAFASAPLHILNKALGYELNYFLDHFEFNLKNKTFFYKGSTIYKEDTTIALNEKKNIERRRRYAYIGSRMHFFRSLWIDDQASTGFSTYSADDKKLDYKDLVFQKDAHTKYIHFKGDIGISYYNKLPTSFMHFLKDMAAFDPSGYFDASAILWYGEMARQRIADSLPFNYVPGTN